MPIWLLGSSDFNARLAAELGLPFAFAAHFATDYLFATISIYRDNFRPSEALARPHVMIGVNAFAADTDEEAGRLFTSLQLAFVSGWSGVGVACSNRRSSAWTGSGPRPNGRRSNG